MVGRPIVHAYDGLHTYRAKLRLNRYVMLPKLSTATQNPGIVLTIILIGGLMKRKENRVTKMNITFAYLMGSEEQNCPLSLLCSDILFAHRRCSPRSSNMQYICIARAILYMCRGACERLQPYRCDLANVYKYFIYFSFKYINSFLVFSRAFLKPK